MTSPFQRFKFKLQEPSYFLKAGYFCIAKWLGSTTSTVHIFIFCVRLEVAMLVFLVQLKDKLEYQNVVHVR